MRSLTTFILAVLFTVSAFSQPNHATEGTASELKIVFDAGLLIGHNEGHYPAPFSSNLSVLYAFRNWFWFGAGSGVQIIGKTFVPLYADARLIPLKSKPLYIYNRSGYTFCVNKNYSEESGNSYYYYGNYPHPLVDNVETRGGLINESGIGVMLVRDTWSTTFSIGYNYQQTKDIYTQDKNRTYNHFFNRVAFRVGFVF